MSGCRIFTRAFTPKVFTATWSMLPPLQVKGASRCPLTPAEGREKRFRLLGSPVVFQPQARGHCVVLGFLDPHECGTDPFSEGLDDEALDGDLLLHLHLPPPSLVRKRKTQRFFRAYRSPPRA